MVIITFIVSFYTLNVPRTGPKMIRGPNKSPSTLDPHYIRVENFELDTVDLAADAHGSNTPTEGLWEILDYDPKHYKMGKWVSRWQ